MNKAGTSATAILHYGTVDCLTFVARELHGTEKKGVSDEMLNIDRTWQNATESKAVTDGSNAFSLPNLQPRTTYFYRLLVANGEGKSWDFVSGSFQTK